jgi:hypothetical protein
MANAAKHRSTAGRVGLAGITTILLLAGCATTPDAIRALPELPAEFAKDLALARTAPVLMTTPVAATPQLPPRPATPLPLVPPRACATVYEGYVTYPITVCHPPTVLDEALARNVGASLPGATTGTLEAKYFKLTSHPAIHFALRPWFCSVRGGPWYGRVEGKQICNVDPNVRLFTAQLLGAPEPIVVTWSGKLEDVPPPLKLVAVSPTGQFCTCCSGVMCPDGSCKPTFDSCQVMPPVLK